MIVELFRYLLGRPRSVSDSVALEVAKAEATRRSWPWVGPFHISRGFGLILVMSNARTRGANVNVQIDAVTGKVRKARFAAR